MGRQKSTITCFRCSGPQFLRNCPELADKRKVVDQSEAPGKSSRQLQSTTAMVGVAEAVKQETTSDTLSKMSDEQLEDSFQKVSEREGIAHH